MKSCAIWLDGRIALGRSEACFLNILCSPYGNRDNLIVLQVFGIVDGMAFLIMGTVEFEPLVTFSCDDPNLCFTLAAIIFTGN